MALKDLQGTKEQLDTSRYLIAFDWFSFLFFLLCCFCVNCCLNNKAPENIPHARSSIWPIATRNKSFKVSQVQLPLPFTLWRKVGKKHNDKPAVMPRLPFLRGHYGIILRGAFTLWQSVFSSIKHASTLGGWGNCKLLVCSFGNVWGVEIPGIYLRLPASCCGLGWEDTGSDANAQMDACLEITSHRRGRNKWVSLVRLPRKKLQNKCFGFISTTRAWEY